jgi:hypothetical protein
MGLSQLATVFAPNLLMPQKQDVQEMLLHAKDLVDIVEALLDPANEPPLIPRLQPDGTFPPQMFPTAEEKEILIHGGIIRGSGDFPLRPATSPLLPRGSFSVGPPPGGRPRNAAALARGPSGAQTWGRTTTHQNR